jgi:SAM-dependent methyltransferase
MVQETALELARLRISPNAEVHQMDAEYLQFPDVSFDYLLCGFAIFFFPQLYRAMSEFRRVLKPNGQIAVTTWDKLMDEQWNWLDEIIKAYLPSEPETDQTTEPDPLPQPVFDTPEGLEAIMITAGFTDIQIIPETAEFIYATEEEWWSTSWSHGMRGALERIEREKGPTGLQSFKAEAFKKLQAIRQTDGIHQQFPVLFALATKPRV